MGQHESNDEQEVNLKIEMTTKVLIQVLQHEIDKILAQILTQEE